jgi:hypothetical protein
MLPMRDTFKILQDKYVYRKINLTLLVQLLRGKSRTAHRSEGTYET